jgi:hypothetical protein
MLNSILWGGVCGAWGAVFCLALTEPGEIFSFVGRFFFWVKRYKFAASPGWKAFEKVAYLCPKCHAGQLALWSFPFAVPGPWAFQNHFAALTVAVFIGFISEKTIVWLSR